MACFASSSLTVSLVAACTELPSVSKSEGVECRCFPSRWYISVLAVVKAHVPSADTASMCLSI